MQSNYFYLWVLGLLLAPATVKGGNKTVTTVTDNTVLAHRNEDGDFKSTTSSMASTSTTLHLSNTTDMQYNHTTIDKTPTSNATLGVSTEKPGGALSSTTATPSSVLQDHRESGKTTGYVALVFLLLAIIVLIVIILLICKKSRQYSFDLHNKSHEDANIPLSSMEQRGVFAPTGADGSEYVAKDMDETSAAPEETMTQAGPEKRDSRNGDLEKAASEDSFGSQIPLTPSDKALDFDFDLIDGNQDHSTKTSVEPIQPEQ